MSDRVVLRFYIAPGWDAMSHVAYVWAPDNWADMDDTARASFLDKEARNWMEQQIECGGAVHDPAEPSDAWESGSSPDDPEEWFW